MDQATRVGPRPETEDVPPRAAREVLANLLPARASREGVPSRTRLEVFSQQASRDVAPNPVASREFAPSRAPIVVPAPATPLAPQVVPPRAPIVVSVNASRAAALPQEAVANPMPVEMSFGEELKRLIEFIYFEFKHLELIQTVVAGMFQMCDEIEPLANVLEGADRRRFMAQFVAYRNVDIHFTMLNSLLFLLQNPRFIVPLKAYTSNVYTVVNEMLDQLYDPKHPLYGDREGALNWVYQRTPQWEREQMQHIESLLDLLTTRVPGIGPGNFYRCVVPTPQFPLKNILMSFRFTSVSLTNITKGDSLKMNTCPNWHYQVVHLVLQSQTVLPGLYVGFISTHPLEHEVLLFPSLQFVETKSDLAVVAQYRAQQRDPPRFYDISQPGPVEWMQYVRDESPPAKIPEPPKDEVSAPAPEMMQQEVALPKKKNDSCVVA